MIDYFASQDIERDGETLADWLARHLGEHAGEARTRLAAMQRARAERVEPEPTDVIEQPRRVA
ncbi:MAG: hypothetical protein KBF56_10225 [Gemmatimonadaceae bacterium]|nr:hypothetical protein [Gemmatimonadaceae bacterium]